MSEVKPRILIVDDREENRYVLCRVLRQAGYDCTEMGSGREALKAAQSLPDLMILDVNLPEISGYEVCRRLKQDPHTSQISILQISASFVSSEDRARALEAGADGYLTHPIDSMVLVATVRALLRLRTAESVARKSADQWQSTFDALSEGLALVDARRPPAALEWCLRGDVRARCDRRRSELRCWNGFLDPARPCAITGRNDFRRSTPFSKGRCSSP